ncbi:MAG: dUTP diphosphatase [Planctomycetota bacterium]
MERIPLKIQRLPHAAGLPLPEYKSASASGMDVCAALDAPLTLQAGAVVLIPTGLTVAVPTGYEVQVRPRSGLALKHGITVVNSPGTVDADYRGEVGVILGNVSHEPFTIERGMRIAQLVVQAVARAEVEVVDALDATDRGAGGFGSSGLHAE